MLQQQLNDLLAEDQAYQAWRVKQISIRSENDWRIMSIEVTKDKVRYLNSDDLVTISRWIRSKLPAEYDEYHLEVISAGYEHEINLTWENLLTQLNAYVYVVTKKPYLHKKHFYGYIIQVNREAKLLVIKNDHKQLIKISNLADITTITHTDPFTRKEK